MTCAPVLDSVVATLDLPSSRISGAERGTHRASPVRAREAYHLARRRSGLEPERPTGRPAPGDGPARPGRAAVPGSPYAAAATRRRSSRSIA
jgi:hypothetical protein